jgi:chromosome segregation ATPase
MTNIDNITENQNCKYHAQQIKDLRDRVEIIEKENKAIREKLIKNNITTQQVADSLPELTKAINGFQITITNVDNNINRLNDGYKYLKKDVKEIKEDLEKKKIDLDIVRKEIITKWIVRGSILTISIYELWDKFLCNIFK